MEALLLSEGFRFGPEPFHPLCRRLLAEPFPLGASLAAFFGYIYIQDRSSMLPPLALAPEAGAPVLDMCASPGGKSIFLAQLAGPAGFLLANEPNPARLATLRANLRAANLPQAATCGYAGEKLPLWPGSWPFILLDPPCSGWGTVKKNPKVEKIWREGKTGPLVSLQRALLRHAASLLAPGGRLLYSTCTTNAEEDERQTEFACQELGLERVGLQPFPGFTFRERPGGGGCLLVDGDASKSQGFYLSLLRRPGELPARPAGKAPNQDNAWLSGPVCDPSLLPPGRAGIFGGKAYFLPAASALIPEGMIFRGALLGGMANGHFRPDARLRVLAPQEGARIVLESPAEARALLSGRAMHTEIREDRAVLWLGDLPLGLVAVKGGRLIAAF